MSRAKKAIAKILEGRSDANLDFGDFCHVLERMGFTRRSGRGSHVIFTRPDVVEIINVQPKSGGKSKPYQEDKSATSFTNTRSTPNNMRYELIIYWSRADESFIVEVPELPGCMADGGTYEEALANAKVVIEEWLATARAESRPIPESRGKLSYA